MHKNQLNNFCAHTHCTNLGLVGFSPRRFLGYANGPDCLASWYTINFSLGILLKAKWAVSLCWLPPAPTVRLLAHVHCKPTHFFFHSFIATISYSLKTSSYSVMKDWADEYHVWGTPTRSPSRSNSR